MIKDSIVYLYYRFFQLYNGPIRSDGPVCFVVGFNACSIINLATRLFTVRAPLIMIDLVVFFIIFVLSPLVIRSNRKFIHTKFDVFKGETRERRRKNGMLIIFYFIGSILFFAATLSI
jgi:hypothetical protein